MGVREDNAERPVRRNAVGQAAAWVGIAAVVAGLALVADVRLPHDDATVSLLLGGAVFALYAVGSLSAVGGRHGLDLMVLVAYGVLFPMWGGLCGMVLPFAGGTVGVPQAVLTGLVLWWVTGAWWVGVGSVVGLGAGLGAVWVMRAADPPQFAVAMLGWHGVVAGTMLAWVWRSARAWGAPIDYSRCQQCGYDLLHIRGEVCPECGTPVSAAGGGA